MNVVRLLPRPEGPFSARLGAARRFTGATQSRMARSVGVSLRTYGDWERGDSYPRVDQLERIMETTGFPVTWFIDAPSDDPDPVVRTGSFTSALGLAA